MFLIGLGFAIYLGVDKLFLNPAGRLLTDRPQFFLALAAMIMGTQFFLSGFVGEMILRSKRIGERYAIYESVNLTESVKSAP